MPTDIDALLNNKSIRIFNTETQDHIELKDLPNSIYERLPGHPEYEDMKLRLQFICDNSETFSSAISTLTPESALWIDLDNDALKASANFFDGQFIGLPDLKGRVSIEPLTGDNPFFQLISKTGNVIDVSFNRTLIHEVSHAVLSSP